MACVDSIRCELTSVCLSAYLPFEKQQHTPYKQQRPAKRQTSWKPIRKSVLIANELYAAASATPTAEHTAPAAMPEHLEPPAANHVSPSYHAGFAVYMYGQRALPKSLVSRLQEHSWRKLKIQQATPHHCYAAACPCWACCCNMFGTVWQPAQLHTGGHK